MNINKLKAVGLMSIPAAGLIILMAQDIGYISAIAVLAISLLLAAIFYGIMTKAFDLWYM